MPQDDNSNAALHAQRPASIPEASRSTRSATSSACRRTSCSRSPSSCSIHEGVARARKQDVIFAAAEGADPPSAKASPPTACWKSCRTASASCARPRRATSPARTTSTSRPARSAASTCAPATTSPAASAGPKDGERYFALTIVDTHQRRAAGSVEEQGAVREPHPAVPAQASFKLERGNGSHRGHHRPHPRSDGAAGQGPARADRVAAEGRQDDDDAEGRHRRSRTTTRTCT